MKKSQIDHIILCTDCGSNIDLCFTFSEEYVCLGCITKREDAEKLEAYIDNEDPKWFEREEQLRDLRAFQRLIK